MILISGPIASGKSALSRAVAAQLEEANAPSAAVIDLDLVYEMLWVREAAKMTSGSGRSAYGSSSS